MRFVLFYHSVVSDWNHGNAHFLRGVATELLKRGHEVMIYEEEDNWSLANLQKDNGDKPLKEFARRFPTLMPKQYRAHELDLDAALAGADVVIVHEWNEPTLVNAIGRHRKRKGGYLLFFHDTHHRAVSAPEEMSRYDLSSFDAALVFGQILQDIYDQCGWANSAWTWHEAADTAVFHPHTKSELEGDLVWIGNWGDGERSEELREFLLEPVKRLRLKAVVHGVRYSEEAIVALREAGIEYRGWLPNYKAPEVFARFRVTVHVPRRPYVRTLPGIPTIRPFEAMACGIPLISAPWDDSEGLFRAGKDYRSVADGRGMETALKELLHDQAAAGRQTASAAETIRQRHTCAHRVEELLEIIARLRGSVGGQRLATSA